MLTQRLRERYRTLTPSQRKAADYILAHEQLCAMSTAAEIARAAGVSDTSVIRLAYALGYGSYREMLRQLRRKQEERERPPEKGTLAAVVQDEIRCLQNLAAAVDPARLRGIARRIAAADRVMIFGYYGEHTVSFELYLMLDALRPDVYYYRHNSMGLRELSLLGSRSVVLATAMSPYSHGTAYMVRKAREHNPYIIAFADDPGCPVAQGADECLCFSVGRDALTGINRMSPAMTLFFALMKEVAAVDEGAALARLQSTPGQLWQPPELEEHVLDG